MIIISTRYSDCPDGGGNRVHKWVQDTFSENVPGSLTVINIDKEKASLIYDVPSNNITLPSLFAIPKVARIFRHKYSNKIKTGNAIVADGFPALIFCLFLFRMPSHYIAHNVEWKLFQARNKRLLSIIVRLIDFLALRKAHIYSFSSNDNLYYYKISKLSKAVLPYSSKSSSAKSNSSLSTELLLLNNFSYDLNIDSTLKFYLEHRHIFFSSVSISTPPNALPPESLKSIISSTGDKVISYSSVEEYLEAIYSAKGVIVAIYSGSGIPIKLIDALYYAKVVYTTRYCKEIAESFFDFKSSIVGNGFFALEEISLKVNCLSLNGMVQDILISSQ